MDGIKYCFLIFTTGVVFTVINARPQANHSEICGLENIPLKKIIGGQESAPNQFPWTVVVLNHKNNTRNICTGSILNKEWILTAAHCIADSRYLEIYAGTHDRTKFFEFHRQRRITNETYPHENYVSTFSEYHDDIALVRLRKPLRFNDNVRPICLPSYSDRKSTFSGKNVTVTGWGLIWDSPVIRSSTLRYAEDVRVIDNRECSEYYDIITDKILCIAFEGKGICMGDSGGPLNYQISEGKYMQIGVANFVSDFTCSSPEPEGFARVTEYLEWIETTTGIKISQ